MAYRLTNTSNGQLSFVDPTNINNKVSVGFRTSKKARLDAPKGKEVTLSRWSLKTIAEVPLPTPAGCEPCSSGRENISFTTTISSSVENFDLAAKYLASHIANLQALQADLLKGIPPSSDITLVTPVTE